MAAFSSVVFFWDNENNILCDRKLEKVMYEYLRNSAIKKVVVKLSVPESYFKK